MRRPDLKRIFRSYAVAWVYLIGFVITEAVCSALSRHGLHAFTAWASTSVHNLEHDPVGSLVVSAFVAGGNPVVWTALIALAVFGANRALGNAAVGLVCLAGQVGGPLVREGI